MSRFIRRLLPAVSLAAMFLPCVALATNGYFLIGTGAKSRAMGGVGVANGVDGLAAAANPAAMADVPINAMRIDIGADIFYPPRSVRHDSSSLPADVKSGANVFLIPNMGAIYKFNRKLTVGMAVTGAGANTRYDQSCDQRPSQNDPGNFFNFNCVALGFDDQLANDTVGASLIQMLVLPSAAYRVNKNHSIGLSLTLAAQQFRAYGLGAFQELGFSAGTEDVTDRGNDYSYGAGIRLGGLHQFFDDRFSIGWNYASRTYMTKFDKYRNLFAEHGGFDIPENYTVGFAVQPVKNLTVAAEVGRIKYSDVKSIANPGPDASNPQDFFPPGYGVTGLNNGLGFGWDDQTVYKVGINYDYNNAWSFRTGFNYAESPIEDDQVLFNTLAPATVEKHFTIGASYRPSTNMEWSFSWVHAFENTIKGPTAFGPQGTAQPVIGENAAISMKQDAVGVSFSYQM